MPIVSKTVEVEASAETILAIVADFEAYPLWNEEVKGVWVLAHYDDGRPSQLRLDASVGGFDVTYVQAIYYPSENQIQTVMQQGDLFSKQEQLFAVVAMGPTTLLTVDLDVARAQANGEEDGQRRARPPGRQLEEARRNVGRQPWSLTATSPDGYFPRRLLPLTATSTVPIRRGGR